MERPSPCIEVLYCVFLVYRIGDYLLSVNGTEVTGLPDTKVQQILRLLPRGIIKLVISTKPAEKEKTGQGNVLSFPTVPHIHFARLVWL